MDDEVAEVVASFDDCTFARTLGLRILSVDAGVVRVEMDGQTMTDGVIPLEQGLVKHLVVVKMCNHG